MGITDEAFAQIDSAINKCIISGRISSSSHDLITGTDPHSKVPQPKKPDDVSGKKQSNTSLSTKKKSSVSKPKTSRSHSKKSTKSATTNTSAVKSKSESSVKSSDVEDRLKSSRNNSENDLANEDHVGRSEFKTTVRISDQMMIHCLEMAGLVNVKESQGVLVLNGNKIRF